MSREVAFAHPQAMHLRDNLEGIKTFGALAMGRRDHLVELSADPYAVDTDRLTDQVKVLGTLMDGVKIDTDAFISKIEAIDPSERELLPPALQGQTAWAHLSSDVARTWRAGGQRNADQVQIGMSRSCSADDPYPRWMRHVPSDVHLPTRLSSGIHPLSG